jgi:cell division septum initiation protein DivIVA
VPLTGNVMVARDAILDLIDQLRVAIPEEVRAAKRINSEGERILEKAQEEASRILSRAQEQAAFLIEERGLTEAAEAESRRIVDEATSTAEEIRRGADAYAGQVLHDLESEALKVLAGIRRGIDVLDERHPGVRAAPGDRRVGLADLGAEEPEPVPAERDEDGDEGIRALLR